jgi:hypothetical protein
MFFIYGPCIISIFLFVFLIKNLVKRQINDLTSIGLESNKEWLTFGACILVFTINFYKNSHVWGGWDAWAIWNLHGKFLFYSEEFHRLFTNDIMWTHPDYPLMTPSLIASFWTSLGKIEPLTPYIVSYLSGLSIVLLLFFHIKTFSFSKNAWLALLILTLTPSFSQFAASQYADTTLALFILIPFIIIDWMRDTNKNAKGMYLLLGFIVGSATWVKNEGLVFCGIFLLAFLFQNIRNPKGLYWTFIGLIIPAFTIVAFKIHFAPENDLVVAGIENSFYDKIFSLDRYLIILSWFAKYTIKDSLVFALLFLIALIRFRVKASMALAVMVLMYLSYMSILLVTPHEINWHVQFSLDRLNHQLTPLLAYVIFTSVYRNNKENGIQKLDWIDSFKELLRIKKAVA